MTRVGFELAIPATKRPQTYALDCVSNGIGNFKNAYIKMPSAVLRTD
jgi:hypothetical protein